MDDKLIKILKEMRTIEPDRAFSMHSRERIISVKKGWAGIFALPAMGARIMVSAAILLIIVTAYVTTPTPEENIVVKADEINTSIQIKLKEIEYLINNQPVVDEATSAKVETLLNNTVAQLDTSNLDSKNPEEVLKKIEDAEHTLKELRRLLKKQ